jgi:nucleobase:cation symporter-1, NCS1 family
VKPAAPAGQAIGQVSPPPASTGFRPLTPPSPRGQTSEVSQEVADSPLLPTRGKVRGAMPDPGESDQTLSIAQTFTIEQKGISHIGLEERHGHPRDLFWMWFATLANVTAVVSGAVIISIGISFYQAIVVIVVGNVLGFATLGIASLQGPSTGTTTMTVSRAAYGPRGTRGLSFFNWLTCVGFEAAGVAIIALAGLAILGKAGISSSALAKVIVLIVAILIQGLLPLFGHAAILTSLRYLSFLFAPLFIAMTIIVAPKVHLANVSHAGSFSTVLIALAVAIGAGGLSFANIGSDYTRYLPSSSNSRSIFWAVSVGSFLTATLLEILGAAIQSVAPASDPISGLPKVLPSGLLIPYLIFAIVTLFAVNTTDLYSSGLTLQTLGVRLKRWQCVIVDLVICAGLTLIVLFSNSFNRLFGEFLSLLVLWLAPWFGIYATDWLMRRNKYDNAALQNETGGAYWGTRGFSIPGVVAMLVGMAAAAVWSDNPVFVGPLSNATSGSDLSAFTGVLVAALVYYVMKRQTRWVDGASDKPGGAQELRVTSS